MWLLNLPAGPSSGGMGLPVGFPEALALPGHRAQSQAWETRRQEGPEAPRVLPCPLPQSLPRMKINEVRFPSTSDLEGWRGWGRQPTDTHVRPKPYITKVMRLLWTQMLGTDLISGSQVSRVGQNLTWGGVDWEGGVNCTIKGEKDHTDHGRKKETERLLYSRHCTKHYHVLNLISDPVK